MKLVTPTGRMIDPANPRVSDICIQDIAFALAKEERFDGNTYVPYSVAQHSCHVADLLASDYFQCSYRLVRAGLLHDAPEAYLGDIVSPIKRLLPDYQRLEFLWTEVIFAAFGVDADLCHCAAVKRADNTIFLCEAVCLTPDASKYGVDRAEADATLDAVHKVYKGIEGVTIPRVLSRSHAASHFIRTAELLNIK